MKIRRLLTVLLTVALAVILLAVGVSAETIVASGTTGNLSWSIDDEGNMLLYGEGSINGSELTWWDYKDQIRTLTVEKGVTGTITGFNSCKNLVSVSLPEGITKVSDFYSCTALKTINIPSTVTEIGGGAFESCTSLKTIKLPKSVTKLGRDAFLGCTALQKITFSEGLTLIDTCCFAGCENLEAIELPASLQNIGNYVFDNCYKLDGIWVNPKSQYFTNDDKGVLFSKDMTELRAAPLCLSGVYTIPQSVTYLDNDAFRFHTKLTGVILSEQITYIEVESFAGCSSLKSITFPKGITFIDSNVFVDCTALKTITFTGSAPVEIRNAFRGITATVYYPAGDETWTEEIMQDYGGDLTWVAYEVDQPVQIVEEPKNTYTKIGKTAKVTLKAQGSGLKYQWYIKNAGAKKYSKSSVTSATYSCKMSEKSKDRRVYCVITDANGEEVKSKSVILREAASITTQPKDACVQSGKSAKVTVKASGDELTYQWYFKNAGSSKFTKSSVTKASYSAKMSDKVKDRQVYCVVTDAYGKTAKTKTVVLRMAATITEQPQNTCGNYGDTLRIPLKANGDGLSYQWYVKNAGSSKFSKSSVTSATYSCKLNEKSSGRQIYCIVTDAYGNTAKSATATVYQELRITSQPKDVTVADGKTAKVSFQAEGYDLTYTWYFKNAGDNGFKKTTSFTGNTYSVKMTDARDGRQVYCVVTDAFGNTLSTEMVRLRMK